MGPMHGYKIVEFSAIGPGPMCAMLLAEMGADVLRVDRIADAGLGIALPRPFSFLQRSRRSIAVDLKKPEGREAVLRLIAGSDALIEGFRPGVMERLGLGPADCARRNPKLVFGRVTGWGQDGPLAAAAGHDLNYIALVGALSSIGRSGHPPTPPLNLVGDFGGGAVYLALGIVAALLEAQSSGLGQTVDAAMIDGAASLMTAAYSLRAAGITNSSRGANILDSGSHYYEVYETADGKFISLAPIESKFYAELLERLGLDHETVPQSPDRDDWPALKDKIAAVIKMRTRDEWCESLEGTDVCFAPVLDMEEAPAHPHNVARNTFVEVEGVVQPGAAPRFSRTPSGVRSPPSEPGEHTESALREWGFGREEVDALRGAGAIR